jgi:hypothetical protein
VLARELFDRVVSGYCASDVAGFLVVIERRGGLVVVVCRVVREVFGWWGMRVPLGSSFARDPILLLYLLLGADALVVDLDGFLWGQPELCGR